ncbi:hypothetical protein BER93_00425 [Xanthomonas fragariae]|nr:hypothetical protein BER92_00425 [Xanthomonas fragariae]AOD16879.1 hypothetical protein BER93_00425 [Xanthomonas fragariae]ENZ96058.1 benzoate permease [Xanthomonas fragariae LMG 25863]
MVIVFEAARHLGADQALIASWIWALGIGVVNTLLASFGGYALNLAVITAAFPCELVTAEVGGRDHHLATVADAELGAAPRLGVCSWHSAR